MIKTCLRHTSSSARWQLFPHKKLSLKSQESGKIQDLLKKCLDIAEAKDIVSSIKFCMNSRLERVFSLGGHAEMKRSCEDRSLYSGNILPKPESLKRTIQGSIDLTNDSAEGLAELEGKDLYGDNIATERGALHDIDGTVCKVATVERSPFENQIHFSSDGLEAINKT